MYLITEKQPNDDNKIKPVPSSCLTPSFERTFPTAATFLCSNFNWKSYSLSVLQLLLPSICLKLIDFPVYLDKEIVYYIVPVQYPQMCTMGWWTKQPGIFPFFFHPKLGFWSVQYWKRVWEERGKNDCSYFLLPSTAFQTGSFQRPPLHSYHKQS